MVYKPSTPRSLLAAAIAGALMLASCGGSDTPADKGDVTISTRAGAASSSKQKDATSVLPDGVDSMQIKFEDAGGVLVLGPIEVAASPVVTIRDVPLVAKSITVDYLRNGGYALATDDEPIAWNGVSGSSCRT